MAEKRKVLIGSLQNVGDGIGLPEYGETFIYGTNIVIDLINNDPEILPDVELVVEILDTRRSYGATKYDIQEQTLALIQEKFPAAIFGASWSSTSMPSNQIASIYNVPQISAISENPELSEKDKFPTFMRTSQSQSEEMVALIEGFLKEHGWTEVTYIADDDDFSRGVMEAYERKLSNRGIATLSTLVFPYRSANQQNLDQPVEEYEAVLNTIEATGSNVHIVTTGVPFSLHQIQVAAMRRGWDMSQHVWITSNTAQYPSPEVLEDETKSKADFYSIRPTEEFIKATQGTFLFRRREVGSAHNSPKYQHLLNAVKDMAAENGLIRCQLGNAKELYDALFTIARAMDKLNSRGELIIPEDSGIVSNDCSTANINMTRYKARNELLHQAMLESSFVSLMTGGVVSYNQKGDLITEYAMHQVEFGEYIPYDSNTWSPCTGVQEPLPYKPKVVASVSTGCFEPSCVTHSKFTFMDGKSIPPPAVSDAPSKQDQYSTIMIVAVGAGVFLVMSVVILFVSRRLSQRNLKVKDQNLQLQTEVARQSQIVTNLTQKLESVVRYSKAEVDLLNKKLKDFHDLDVTKSATNYSELGQTAAHIRRSSLDQSTRTLNSLKVDSKEIQIGSLIGKGGFGEVYRGVYRGQDVAIKTLKVINEDNLERFKAEILMMNNLHHTNVTFLVSVCWDEKLIGLLMELSDVGPLKEVLSTPNNKFTWKDPLFKYALDVAFGLQYLHNCKWFNDKTQTVDTSIIHRDIKPDNVLVFAPDTCKLTDFGEARAVQLHETMTQVGTAIYMAPEVTKGDRYTLKADVYSYGMLLLQIDLRHTTLQQFLRQQFAFERKRTMNMTSLGVITHALVSGWRPSHPNEIDNVSPALWHSIELMMDDDPESRPTMDSITEHLQEVVKPEIYSESLPKIRNMNSGKGLMAKTTVRQRKQATIYKVAEALVQKFKNDRKTLDVLIDMLHDDAKKPMRDHVSSKLEYTKFMEDTSNVRENKKVVG